MFLKKKRYLSILLTTQISSDSDKEDSDEEIFNEENSDEKIKYRMCLVFVFEAFWVIWVIYKIPILLT